MIPKKIHYCWFGKGTYSKLTEKCIESWKFFCPDYELICWNEDNSPIRDNPYVKQAYEAKKWAFVSDYVRLRAVEVYGGIYLDIDVELIRSLDDFLSQSAFMGFECLEKVATCVIGANAGHPMIKAAAEKYQNIYFLTEDGGCDFTTNVERLTSQLVHQGLLLNNELQIVNDITVYPSEFFSPKDLQTGKVAITPNTYAVHHFNASWMTYKQRFHMRIAQLIGPEWTKKIKEMRINE